MKLFFFPDYTSTNPYQDLLYSELTDTLVAAGDIDTAIESVQSDNHAEQVVFHLHWQNVITGGARNSHEHRLQAKQFLSKLELFKASGGFVIWTIHNKLPHDTKFLVAEREYHNALSDLADMVLLHDESAFDAVNKEYTVSREKVKIINHGNYIDSYPNDLNKEEARREVGISDEALVFGFIGQLRPYKGLSEFIESVVPLTRKYNVNALIAGKPVWPFSAGKITQQCSPFSKVKVVEGFIPDDELQIYLNSSDIIVLPYRDILTSGSVLLAASFGKPVIVPDIEAFQGIKHHDFVFTYEPEGKKALRQRMEELAKLDSPELIKLKDSALAYAKSLDWSDISKCLASEIANLTTSIVTEFTANYEDKQHTVEVHGDTSKLEKSEIAVCVVNYKSADQIKQLHASMKQSVNCDWKLLILDNSESDTEFSRLCSMFRDAVIMKPTSNLGYAGGNNVLVNYAKQVRIKNIAILNPDIILTEDVFAKIIPQINQKPNAIHAPVVLKDNGLVSFYSATFDSSSSLVNIKHHYDGKPLSDLPQGEVSTDILNGCALFFNADIVDTFNYIPEEYFLYFEETDWTWGVKNSGGELLVHTNTKIVHTKDSQKGGLPTIPYTYYLLRSALLFASKHGFDVTATEQKYTSTFVKPWIGKLSQRAPDFVNCFEALCKMAFEHGRSGIEGPIEIFDELYKFSSNTFDSEGFIEGISTREIRGWAVADRSNSELKAKLLYFVNQSYKTSLEPSIKRADIAALGYQPIAAFSHMLSFDEVTSDISVVDAYSLKKLNMTEEASRTKQKSKPILIPGQFQPPSVKVRVEGIKDGYILGWALDESNPNLKVELELLINGERAAITTANIFREDLLKAKLSGGQCAFRVLVEPRLLESSEVNVEARLLGDSVPQTARKMGVDLPLKGYDHHTNMKDFFNWSFENVVVPFGQFEKSLKLQRELAFVKDAMVADAYKVTDKKRSLISIIMPAFNREDVIEMAINSVIGQSFDNYELIVVDDGSSDSTCDVVERLISENPNVKISLIRSPFNGGVSAARNIGLKKVNGDIICYLDSDNEWHEDYLLLVNATYHKNPKADSAYAGQEIWFSDPVYGREFRTSIRMLPFNRAKLENGNFIDLNVFSHRKSTLEQFGGFREDIRRLVDWELILRYTETKPPAMIPALMNRYFFGLVSNQITSVEGYEQNLAKLLKGLN